MAFRVALEFDDQDDFFGLLVKLAVPDNRLDLVLSDLTALHAKANKMSAAMDALKAEVAATRGAMDSATALIEGVAARIEAAREDPEALMALVADLRKDREELSTAVATDQASQGAAGEGEQPMPEGEGVPPDATQPDTGTTVPPTTDPGTVPQV